ncbi:MAG TPA: hypothetical protein VJM32_01230 [Candidatus Saccharimonadales bacterium]|nr:hypothetical protein [Candidatus Saccharimonadales bacterium]
MEPAGKMIERITYTASLATRFEDIDTMLDPVRRITSDSDPSQPLSADQQTTLQGVQHQLEDYLVTRESLRRFTLQSLQLQIDQHMQGNVGHKSRTQAYIVISVALASAAIAASLPFLSDLQQRGLVFGATTFSLITVGAAWLFLTALTSFKSELRRAFVVICSGVTLLGLSLLGQPIMEVFDLRHYPLTSILYSLPIFIAAILFHTGNVMFAKLVGVKNFWTTAWPIVIAGVPLTLITLLLPHMPVQEPPFIFHLTAIMWGWMLLTPIVSAIILRMALRRLPELYKPPVHHLHQAMFGIIAVVLYQYVLRVIAGPYMEGPVAYVLFALVLCMGLLLLRAGYTFNKVSRY